MNKSSLEEVKTAVNNWWVSLVLGIMFVAISLWLMFSLIEGCEALIIVFSACMFASGVLDIVFAVGNRKTLSGWGWYLMSGVIDLILGVFLICYPGMTALILPLILAFWIMFRGFTSIGYAMDLNRVGVKGWGWYMTFGILAIICSITVIWNPDAGALASAYIVFFAFMFMGFFRIMPAFGFEKFA